MPPHTAGPVIANLERAGVSPGRLSTVTAAVSTTEDPVPVLVLVSSGEIATHSELLIRTPLK